MPIHERMFRGKPCCGSLWLSNYQYYGDCNFWRNINLVNKKIQRKYDTIIYVVRRNTYVYGQNLEDNFTNKWEFTKVEKTLKNPQPQYTQLNPPSTQVEDLSKLSNYFTCNCNYAQKLLVALSSRHHSFCIGNVVILFINQKLVITYLSRG